MLIIGNRQPGGVRGNNLLALLFEGETLISLMEMKDSSEQCREPPSAAFQLNPRNQSYPLCFRVYEEIFKCHSCQKQDNQRLKGFLMDVISGLMVIV